MPPQTVPNIQVDLVESTGRMSDATRYWRRLRHGAQTDSIFQTPEWIDTWVTVFGKSRKFWSLGVEAGDEILGLAPLMLQTVDGTHRELQFAAGTHGDYGDFLYSGAPAPVLTAIGRTLATRTDAWDSFYVRNVPTHSPTYKALGGAMRAAGLHCFLESHVPAPALALDPRSCEALLAKYSLRRPSQRMQRAGRVEFKLLDDAAQVRRYLPLFFAQHQRRWRKGAVRSPFGDERYRRWFALLADMSLARGWLHFSVLELDDLPVAMHFGFRYQNRLIWYKPSYSVEHSRLSPGMVLVTHLIRDALANDCTELDFTIGNEPFKQRFANIQRHNANFRIYHDPARYYLARAGGLIRNVLKGGLRTARSLVPGSGTQPQGVPA